LSAKSAASSASSAAFSAIDPSLIEPADRHKMSLGTVVPRPIAWTSTVDDEGRANLAPFSYFMGCHSYVPALAISVGTRPDGRPKDTRANIAASGQFVVNVVTSELVARMNVTAAGFPPGVDEIEAAGLTAIPSVKVRPPRIKESPIQIECEVMHAIDLGEAPKVSTLFIGRVLMWHVREDLMDGPYKVDQAALDAVGRMGGPYYANARDPFALSIPDWRDVLPGHPEAG
jgi:flavin reductase (DIM6/NTAB) family NADH-FMN oxidoreductase RutF